MKSYFNFTNLIDYWRIWVVHSYGVDGLSVCALVPQIWRWVQVVLGYKMCRVALWNDLSDICNIWQTLVWQVREWVAVIMKTYISWCCSVSRAARASYAFFVSGVPDRCPPDGCETGRLLSSMGGGEPLGWSKMAVWVLASRPIIWICSTLGSGVGPDGPSAASSSLAPAAAFSSSNLVCRTIQNAQLIHTNLSKLTKHSDFPSTEKFKWYKHLCCTVFSWWYVQRLFILDLRKIRGALVSECELT